MVSRVERRNLERRRRRIFLKIVVGLLVFLVLMGTVMLGDPEYAPPPSYTPPPSPTLG